MTKEEKTELVKYRLNRSKETLADAEFQAKHQKWSTAVNRLYYACYYAAIALLAQYEIHAKSHTGVRQMLGLHFIKPEKISRDSGDFYTDVFEMRHTGDYDDFIEFDEETITALISPAHDFIAQVETILSPHFL